MSNLSDKERQSLESAHRALFRMRERDDARPWDLPPAQAADRARFRALVAEATGLVEGLLEARQSPLVLEGRLEWWNDRPWIGGDPLWEAIVAHFGMADAAASAPVLLRSARITVEDTGQDQ